MAQSVERHIGNVEVTSSILVSSFFILSIYRQQLHLQGLRSRILLGSGLFFCVFPALAQRSEPALPHSYGSANPVGGRLYTIFQKARLDKALLFYYSISYQKFSYNIEYITFSFRDISIFPDFSSKDPELRKKL